VVMGDIFGAGQSNSSAPTAQMNVDHCAAVNVSIDPAAVLAVADGAVAVEIAYLDTSAALVAAVGGSCAKLRIASCW
jgi:hypothetical protein